MRLILLLILIFGYLQATSREALLIGNSNYKHISNLKNPKSSIKKLKKALERLNFHVITAYNLNAENLSIEIEHFRDRLNSNTIGFFYYSGHGCQLNQESYLVPTNLDTTKSSKIKYNALSIGELLYTLHSANNRVNMLFLDACRDIPIGARGGTKGLGQINTTPKGTLIVYATEAGKVADDSTLFINELTRIILQPNKKVWEIGNHLSNVIASKTKDRQIPEMFSKRLPSRLVLFKVNSKVITIVDGLLYQNQPFSSKDKKNYDKNINGGRVWSWNGAKKYCQKLKLNGYSDWRLPTKSELMRLLTKKKNKNSSGYQYFIKKEFVDNMPPLKGMKYPYSVFWSASKKDSTNSWLIYFSYGYDGWNKKSYKGYTLCVR